MQLTQEEKILLQQQQQAEEVCINKYQNLMQQAQDQKLKNLFSQYGQQEQQHFNTIQQMLQGQQPGTNAPSPQSQSQGQYLQNLQAQAGSNTNDTFLVKDALMAEKYVSSAYNSAIFQSANPAVRQALKHIQQEEQQHGEGLYDYLMTQGITLQP